MIEKAELRLFILRSAAIKQAIEKEYKNYSGTLFVTSDIEEEDILGDKIAQFSMRNRGNAAKMAVYYQAFYLLENHIRKLVVDTLSTTEEGGFEWWDKLVPQHVREEAQRNRTREESSGMRFRSDEMIDYITFGQLSDIIKDNWQYFGGIFSDKSAVLKILSVLNSLRGPIAHCGILPDDEIARLKISIRDWFYVAG